MAFDRNRASSIVACSLILASLAQGADWPQWRGLNRDGVSPETGWLDAWPPEGVWTQQVGFGYSAPSISEGRVYALGSRDDQDTVYCFDALTGTQLWSYAYACSNNDDYVQDFPGPRASPTIDGDAVYTFSHAGDLYCLDKTSGAMRWNKKVTAGRPWWGYSGSPLIEGDRVILHAGAGGTAVDKNPPHNILWTSGGRAAYSSPIAFTWGGQRHVAIYSQNGLFGVNPQTGQTNWSFPWSSWYNAADPIVYGDKVFITENGERYECALLQLGSGRLTGVWSNYQVRSECATPVAIGDHLYAFDYGDLVCLDLRTGAPAWTQTDLSNSEATLIAADGRLVALTRKGALLVCRAAPDRFTSEGRTFVPIMADAASEEWMTSPALSGGRLYCRSRQGTLLCLRLAGRPADHDGDGVADTWEQERFGGTNLCDGTADADKDGRTDFEEYVAGTDPTNGNSRFTPTLTATEGRAVVTWPTSAVGGTGYDENGRRSYSLERCSDLIVGDWAPVPYYDDVGGSGAMVSYTNTTPADQAYYRIRTTLR